MSQPVKVLVISDYRMEISSRPEAEAMIGLQKAGCDLTIMTYDEGFYPQKFRDAGIRVIPFHPEKKMNKKEIKFIREELIRGDYDILQLFNGKAIINGLAAAKNLSVKVVLYRGFAGHVHWYDPAAYFKFLHPRVDKIICITNSIKQSIDKNLFFNKSKTVKIIKGHSADWYKNVEPVNKKDHGIPTDAFVITMVANVRPFKGVPYLIKSSYHLPPDLPIHFVLIGRGMDDPGFRKMIEKSEYRKNFHIPGFVNDPLPWIAASNVLVLPSTKGEGINKTVVEAMNLAVPAIVTNIDNNEDLFVENAKELVVPVKDEQAITNAILNLYHNPQHRDELGKRSKEHINRHLNIVETIAGIKKLYEDLAKEKRIGKSVN